MIPTTDAELLLPATLLSRYLFFLGRRPVSSANVHYVNSRVAGLQSLGPLFDDPRIASALRALTPQNLFRVAPQIQTILQPQLATRTPRDLVATARAPEKSFWSDARRAVVVYGPAIGIGDEIVTSSVALAMRRIVPSVTVLSAYDELWDRLAPDQPVEHYRDLRTLVEILRSDAFDAVVYVDFEPPGLVNAIAHEPQLPRFLELSLGTRQLTVLDNKNRRLHQMRAVAPYCENFYATVDHMLVWLGMNEEERPQSSILNPQSSIHVVLSPFTSKEDPSESLWLGVLSCMPRETRIILDTGPNATTRAFAIHLRDALRAHDLHCDLAASGRAASLGEMLDLVRDADVVISADSYLAHAAPALGTKTFVIAREGLEPWRVPSPSSFYFRSDAAPAAIGAAIHALLGERRTSPRERVEAKELREAASAIDFAAPLDQLLRAWQRCFDAHNAVVAALSGWPRVYEPLFEDGISVPRMPSVDGIAEEDLRAHLRNRFAECANSNLWKFLRGVV